MNAEKLSQLRDLTVDMANLRLFQIEAMGDERIAKKIQRWAVRLAEALAEYDAQAAQAGNSLLIGTTPAGRPYGLHGTRESVEAVSDLIEAQATQPSADAEDTARLNWLALHPRSAQIVVDGTPKACIFWGISSAPEITIREAIDAARAAEGDG